MLRWPVALLSLFLCISLALYSKFVDMTINLSLILKKKDGYRNIFRFSVFVFIDPLVVSAYKGGHSAIRFPAKIT